MSMQKKAALLIIIIVVLLVSANFGAGMFFTQSGLNKTMDRNLSLACDIASDLISTKINLLKSDAQTVAEHLLNATLTNEDLEPVMREQLENYPDFCAFTVFDKNGIVDQYGFAPTAEQRLNEKYIQEAFAGEAVISTTRNDERTGELVLHVCVPMGSTRVLSVTIPGMLFTDLIRNYKLWTTGNLIINDEDGIVIADGRYEYLVRDRWNFIEMAKESTDPEVVSVAKVFDQMIHSESGAGQLVYDGVKRFCTYKHIPESTWFVAVMAPLPESPTAGVQSGLLLSSLLFLIVGIVITIIVSKIVARPYYKIEEQARNLEHLNEIANAALDAKSSFLANMSHEMRTPLNAIIGLSDLTLGTETLNGENRENTEKVYGAGMTLLGIVNDILDLSKIESGKFDLNEEECDTPSLINDVAIINAVRIGSKPIVFNIDITEDFPARLFGDEIRVKQMFNNLLSNAFKYTKEGRVDWVLRAEKISEGYRIISEVRDTGIGIKTENIGRIFGDYNQLYSKINRQIEGTGLGLSITKQLAASMGGDISVESEYGKGSVFTIRFIQGDVGAPAIGADIAAHLRDFHYTDRNRIRNQSFVRVKMPYANVLVVDDVSNNLDVVRGILKPYEIQVDCVMDGKTAVERIRTAAIRYDAIFMDHMMPDMDGIEATRIIREEIDTDYARNVPIFALTANAIVGNEEMFLNHGFQAFLSKPIDILAIDAVLRRWVRDKKRETDTVNDDGASDAISKGARNEDERRSLQERRSGYDRRARKEALKTIRGEMFSKLHMAGIDVEQGLRRFNGEEIYLEILTAYSKSTPELLEQLMSEEISTEKYGILLHGIKGSCRNIGAEVLGTKAEALEKAAKSGNTAYIEANGEAFACELDEFLSEIKLILREVPMSSEKSRLEAPNPIVLAQLKKACSTFDMTGIDVAMEELGRYDYETGSDLVTWLAEQIILMGLDEIVERLAEEGIE